MVVAINPVARPQQERGVRKTNMDKLFQALQIANAGMGIAVNYQNFQKVREDREAAPAIREQEAQLRTEDINQKQAQTRKIGADTAQTEAVTANLPTPEQARKKFDQDLKQSQQVLDQKLKSGRIKNAQDLRREWSRDPITIASKNGKVAIDKIRSAGIGEPSAAKDHAMIFNYMMTVDPGSTVKEGEFATVQQAGGIVDRATVGLFNRTLEGEMLTPQQREDFLKVSEDLWQQQVNSQQNLNKQYQDLAGRSGIPAQDVVLDLGISEAKNQFGGLQQQQEQQQAGAPQAPAAPPSEFSEEEIKAVMDGSGSNRAQAIIRLKAAQQAAGGAK